MMITSSDIVKIEGEPPQLGPESSRDPYAGVVVVLLGAAALGAVGALAGGWAFSSAVLFDVAVTLGLSTGILSGVALAQIARAKAAKNKFEQVSQAGTDTTKRLRLSRLPVHIQRWFQLLQEMGAVRVSTAMGGAIAIGLILFVDGPSISPTPELVAIAAAACVAAAGLAATAVHYLADIDPNRLPEATGLCRGARVVGWILTFAAMAIGLEWAAQRTAVRVVHWTILAINLAVVYELVSTRRTAHDLTETFPLDLDVLSVFGSRTNILASAVDAAEQQLGIDLRSTWALTVIRQGLEPLILGLGLVAWLSTSLTVVGVAEQGLVERLGVPVSGEPLAPGIHVHWPWPIDQVFRIPVQRVQALTVGHEGKEPSMGPEDVLWARQHAENEYTLLLGNGRDLITIDAAVGFRIIDARAWRYNCQNPADALRAIAHRAVMRNTVNQTLAEALSENVVTLTARMRAMVQRDADALRLGIAVVGFTVGGMHPPVNVASDYQAVVSAELGKVTAVVDAQALRNRIVPAAETSALVDENTARAEGVNALARAAGEAWSFRTLESQYQLAPEEYFFRRRLETLEKGLFARRFTVVDSRIQRDGGELWVIP
jgi:regulator of protease activity HflC (stomatin/prohibitin superfamily)